MRVAKAIEPVNSIAELRAAKHVVGSQRDRVNTGNIPAQPVDELEAIAEDFGLDPTRFKTRQHLVVAIHERRQLIAAMDRDAMIDVVRWGRRPVMMSASKEQIAQEITRM